MRTGTYPQLHSSDQSLLKMKDIDPVLKKHQDIIHDFTYITPDIKGLSKAGLLSIKTSDSARIN